MEILLTELLEETKSLSFITETKKDTMLVKLGEANVLLKKEFPWSSLRGMSMTSLLFLKNFISEES